MSPQARYYPVEASELNRQYKFIFEPRTTPNYDVIRLERYQYSSAPNAKYADRPDSPMLSDRTGGGYNGHSLNSWVGFLNSNLGYTTVQITGDLGIERAIHSVRALSQSWLASGIYHPSQIDVKVSSDGRVWTEFGSTSSFPGDTPNFAVMWGDVDGSASARYVRWTFTYREWLFLAELEVLGA
jgi:hypothetical protein